MAPRLQKQKNAFDFLSRKFRKQESFTLREFQQETGWGRVSFRTYLRKHFESLLLDEGNGNYRLSEAFRRFSTWTRFRTLVSQKRVVARQYTTISYDNVVQFEFFLPLSHEEYLRKTLDSLFFKDTIISKLHFGNKERINKEFPLGSGETSEEQLERVCGWISEKFVGYSISHVHGRFRVDDLKSLPEVYKDDSYLSTSYLADETTAIVKFVFPCGKGRDKQFDFSEDIFEDFFAEENLEAAEEEATKIRWLFYELFMKSIVQLIEGEDEIWLLESGMRNKLHIWKVQ